MANLFYDLETVGLHGMPVLLQYAVDDGEIVLYDIWKEPIGKTLDLIEWMMGQTVIGFNMAYDHFHLSKCYTVFRLCPRGWIPERHIEEIAAREMDGRDGPCIKPANCLDLLLHSRKGAYQALMAREDIRIRRVPTPLAYALAEELEDRIEIDGIFFARKADPDSPRWQVFDIKKRDGSIHPDLKDVVLRFRPAGGLKFLAEHALGYEPKFHFKDVELDTSLRPKELGYAPFALAVSNPAKNWEVTKTNKRGERYVVGYAWPGVIRHHIEHWATNENARLYATDDIVYTRGLYKHFGEPPAGDNDSVLACMVAAVRWHGFKIDTKGIRKLYREARRAVANAPCNINKPPAVRRYVCEAMDDMEALALEASTKKANLTAVSNWKVDADEPCTKCDGAGCARCVNGVMKAGIHPAATRAQTLLDVKMMAKKQELYRKLLKAGRFHASFNVIGALSSRMSGADGLNAQGIDKTKEVRIMFPLAWEGYELCGGDFSAFEITLADAVYNDPDLRATLLAGKKIHALFAQCLFPGTTYEEVLASEGTKNDMYTKGKSAVFALIYGGNEDTIVRNLGVSRENAINGMQTWNEWFPQMAKARERTFKAFCSMRQLDNSQVVWAEPSDYIETFLGFRRYYTLENKIARALFELAKKPPTAWRDCKIKILRNQNKGLQTASGAVASALYGAAFQIQAANQRAAANHEIQSAGADITKAVQRKVWDIQPAGVHEFLVAPMNIHDEILSVTHPSVVERVAETVRDAVEAYRPQVPLIGMKWNLAMASWAEKKGGSRTLEIKAA